MNRLHLLRHAKSAAKEELDDHERALSRRGREAAHRIGRRLPALVGAVDLVLCSSALRTRETLDLAFAEFTPKPRTLIENELYLASRDKLLGRLRRLGEADLDVLLIGHNPGLHDLAVALADKSSPQYHVLASGKFPTAALASFEIAPAWSALGYSPHRLIGYVTPESLPGDKV